MADRTQSVQRRQQSGPSRCGRSIRRELPTGRNPTGFYYSLWDRNFPRYEDDAANADYMAAQIEELLTRYGDVVELWFDGAWDKDHPTRNWPFDPAWESGNAPGYSRGERGRWCELYQRIHELQPDCQVVMNSSSDRPGGVKYLPVDVRTSEHYHFVRHDRLHQVVPDTDWSDDQGGTVHLPIEFCTTLNPPWFWSAQGEYVHPSAGAIADWYRTARSLGGNFLLNAGPDSRGASPSTNE